MDRVRRRETNRVTKEIVLPYDLYQRIKASAGEHGGIGRSSLFAGPETPDGCETGVPLCAHGHAWGTCVRYNTAYLASLASDGETDLYEEPELVRFLGYTDNDNAISIMEGRIPFDEWCHRLNVKCGPKPLTLEEIGRIEDSRPADYGEQIGFAPNFAASLIGGEE